MPRTRDCAFTLIELLVVIGIMALLMAVLLPSLSRARQAAMKARMEADQKVVQAAASPDRTQTPAQPPPLSWGSPARIKAMRAEISLLPRLSVGTADPESIYEAQFKATIQAQPAKGDAESEIELPLPPKMISLADLSVTLNGAPADTVALRNEKLVWHGQLPTTPSELSFTYSAVGRGLYTFDVPPGNILDSFQLKLTAHESDVRMFELSLQPTSLSRSSNSTTYTWNYSRLLLGRPIQVDVLGIAPIDRLGELSWLGPMSVIIFGLVIGLVAYTYCITQFDRWTLLLVLGTFAGSYPLMYFAQEFIPLKAATLGGCGVVLAIIGIRALTAMPAPLATIGIVLPAAVILAFTLLEAVRPHLQGILLTSEALALFVFAMALLPKLSIRPAGGAEPALA